MLTAPWNIWQLTDHPEARLWACMCGVNNVNLPLIYDKLRQSTLTLTDYRFSTSLTKWPSLNKVTTSHSRAKYNSCTPCAARYPSVVFFEGPATGRTNLRNIHSGWIAWQKSRTTGTNGRRPLQWLCYSGHSVALVVHRAQKSVPDSAGEWPTFLPPPLESCSGTTNVDGPNWTLRNKLQWNFNQNAKLFIHENASENIVCETAAILSMGRWVNSPSGPLTHHNSEAARKSSQWIFPLHVHVMEDIFKI